MPHVCRLIPRCAATCVLVAQVAAMGRAQAAGNPQTRIWEVPKLISYCRQYRQYFNADVHGYFLNVPEANQGTFDLTQHGVLLPRHLAAAAVYSVSQPPPPSDPNEIPHPTEHFRVPVIFVSISNHGKSSVRAPANGWYTFRGSVSCI